MKLEPGKYYTIETELLPLLAVTRQGQTVLKNLQTSHSWNTPQTSGEYFEGYAVQGQQLVPIQSKFSNGWVEKCVEHREPVALRLLRECEYEIVTVDMGEW